MKIPVFTRLDRLPRLIRQLSSKQNQNSSSQPHYGSRNVNIPINSINQEYVDYSDEVFTALSEGKPVVTLETAIVTHGMPHPTNVETALKVQNIVREKGAVPATIAIVKGRIKVGVDDETLNYLATNETKTFKTSYRDLPYVLSQKLNGGTTVSTTLAVSKAAGVPVMVTGGIGGVHRGGETSMDVSADLIELGCSPVGVVCSGVKSILDIERTLEYLETQGVLVATFGPTKDFPAFYSVDSGFHSPYNVKTTEEAAGLIHVMKTSTLRSGIVIAVPVPNEHAIPNAEMEFMIQEAVQEAKETGVRGKYVTPYVLSRIVRSTNGRSLSTNVALIQNNAEIGAKIAVDLARLQPSRAVPSSFPKQSGIGKSTPDVMVIGGAVVDNITKLSEAIQVSSIVKGLVFKGNT